MSKVRHYCVTFFNKPTTNLPEKVRYAIYGEEVCPTTNKTHWQSYIELNSPQRMAAIKKMYNDNTIHIEERRGTREEARTYCMKDNKYEEYGKWISGQGHRSDLDDIVEQMKQGKKLTDVMLENPKTYCQYRNGLRDINATIVKKNVPAWRDVDVELVTGPTGVGKTRDAVTKMPDAYKTEGRSLAWWQDYDGEDELIIDEYDNDVPITQLLNILDGYKLRLNVKGSHTYANWTKVVITTNLKVHELHSNAKPAHRDALFRRIKKINNYWDDEVHGNTDMDPDFE